MFQKLEETIKWLDAWENDKNDKIEKIKKKFNEVKKPLKDELDQKIKQAKAAAKLQKVKYEANDEIRALTKTIKDKAWLTIEEIKKVEKNYFTNSTFKGFRMSLASTVGLSKFLLEQAGFEYVLTRKMNQDPLEVSFLSKKCFKISM